MPPTIAWSIIQGCLVHKSPPGRHSMYICIVKLSQYYHTILAARLTLSPEPQCKIQNGHKYERDSEHIVHTSMCKGMAAHYHLVSSKLLMCRNMTSFATVRTSTAAAHERSVCCCFSLRGGSNHRRAIRVRAGLLASGHSGARAGRHGVVNSLCLGRQAYELHLAESGGSQVACRVWSSTSPGLQQ